MTKLKQFLFGHNGSSRNHWLGFDSPANPRDLGTKDDDEKWSRGQREGWREPAKRVWNDKLIWSFQKKDISRSPAATAWALADKILTDWPGLLVGVFNSLHQFWIEISWMNETKPLQDELKSSNQNPKSLRPRLCWHNGQGLWLRWRGPWEGRLLFGHKATHTHSLWLTKVKVNTRAELLHTTQCQCQARARCGSVCSDTSH